MSLLALNRSPVELFKTLTPKVQSLVQDYTSILNIWVHWGEQDSYAHLNNVAYARYAESSRIAFFEQVIRPSISKKDFEDFIKGEKISSILKEISIKYKAPVLFPDTIIMASRVRPENVQVDRFLHEFIAVSVDQERIVASGEAVVVTFDYEKQEKAPIPDSVRKAMLKSASIKDCKL